MTTTPIPTDLPEVLQRLHDMLYSAQRLKSMDGMHSAITATRIELASIRSAAILSAAAPAAPAESMEWDAWRLALAEKVDEYIQADHDGEGDDEAYADLKAHILKTPFAAPQAQQPGAAEVAPIDMVLHCPACGLQHIDRPDNSEDGADWNDPEIAWTNPPHRSHLCHGCGHIWRPADVPTNGVRAAKTTGKADSPIAARAGAQAAPSVPRVPEGWKLVKQSRLDTIAEHAVDPSVPAYRGRNYYDEGKVHANWDACRSGLSYVRDEIEAIQKGWDDEDLQDALAAAPLAAGKVVACIHKDTLAMIESGGMRAGDVGAKLYPASASRFNSNYVPLCRVAAQGPAGEGGAA